MNNQVLSINELISLTGFSRTKVYKEVKRGALPYLKIGRNVRFLHADVMAYLQKHRVQTPEPETVN